MTLSFTFVLALTEERASHTYFFHTGGIGSNLFWDKAESNEVGCSGVDFPRFVDSRETGIFPEFSGFPGKFPGKL